MKKNTCFLKQQECFHHCFLHLYEYGFISISLATPKGLPVVSIGSHVEFYLFGCHKESTSNKKKKSKQMYSC